MNVPNQFPKPAGGRAAPELLAPAGDWASLRAAIAGGADAVYFGLRTGFNARARAANFATDELADVMAELRGHGLRGYLTLNTLVFSEEWTALEAVVRRAAGAGVDAVLVQDFGAAQLIRAICPSLELHASTQMTLASAESIDVARRLGIARVVLPRELTIEQILAVRRNCDLGLEVFVHGALCISFSGQCAASLSLGGRSANRGQCAQACRLPYRLVCDGRPISSTGAYPLSPNDLAALDLIPQLTAAGVDAFKIEGRMKGPDYVFTVASAYRRAIDRCTAELFGQSGRATAFDSLKLPSDRAELGPIDAATAFAGTFSRGFCRGWLQNEHPSDLVAGLQPGHRGQLLGVVEAVLDAVDAARISRANKSNRRQRRDASTADRAAAKRGSCPAREPIAAAGRRPQFPPAQPALRIWLTADLALGDGIAIGLAEPLANDLGQAVDQPKRRGRRKTADEERSMPAAAPAPRDVVGGRVVAITSVPDGRPQDRAFAGETVLVVMGRSPSALVSVRPGMLVFKTDDATAAPLPVPKKMAIDVQVRAVAGEPLTLTAQFSDGPICRASSPEPLASASCRPTDADSVAAAASRFGDTPFTVRQLDVQIDGMPLVPLSLVNQLRRDLIGLLLAARRPPGHATLSESPLPELRCRARVSAQAAFARAGQPRERLGEPEDRPSGAEMTDGTLPTGIRERSVEAGGKRPMLTALCRSVDQVAATLDAGCRELIVDLADENDWRQADRLCRQAGVRWLAAAPRIHKPGESVLIERLLALQPDGVLARNLAALTMAASRVGNVVADYSLNAVNELSAAWLIEQGASRVAVALDAHLGSVDQWMEHLSPGLLEMVVHLHVPMFHTAHCLYSAGSCCGRAGVCRSRQRPQCRRGRWRVKDRLGIDHSIGRDLACRVTVFHAWLQSAVEWAPRLARRGLGRFRIEWPPELERNKLAATLSVYRDVLEGRCDGQTGWRRLGEIYPNGLTRGLWRVARPSWSSESV